MIMMMKMMLSKQKSGLSICSFLKAQTARGEGGNTAPESSLRATLPKVLTLLQSDQWQYARL